ncbi:MAG TPA: hypothetical protein VKX41_15400 [Alloacidobacterium sp.]|nr:hypothetical protein [Alloacidobacterium sp.]
MYKRAFAITLVISPIASVCQHVHTAPAPTDPPILLNINPEARVSVALGGVLPRLVACGQPAVLVVRVQNQGFVTSRLEAELVGNVPAEASLDFHPEPLKGWPEELRELRITLLKPGLTDLTVAFRSQNEAGDIGGRDRVHFLMRCFAP